MESSEFTNETFIGFKFSIVKRKYVHIETKYKIKDVLFGEPPKGFSSVTC